MFLRSLVLLASLAASPSLMAADTAPASLYVNDGAARPIASMTYSPGILTAEFVGFTFCNTFAGLFEPATALGFWPIHGNFFGTFSVSGVTDFVYAGSPVGNQARLAVCPVNAAGAADARCNGTKVSCLSMESDGTRVGDEKAIFRGGFDDRARGSYVVVTSVSRPTQANMHLRVGVDYHIPGSGMGLPSQSYATSVSSDASVLACPFGLETFFATVAPQVIHREYDCSVPVVLPAAGSPLMAVMLFMQPGDFLYHPAFDSASDNMVLVRM